MFKRLTYERSLKGKATKRRYRYSPKGIATAKIWNRLRTLARYGLTPETFNAILAAQGFKCAICRRPNPNSVDHDHKCCPSRESCGRCVRGILCRTCNAFRYPSEAVVIAAAAYFKGLTV